MSIEDVLVIITLAALVGFFFGCFTMSCLYLGRRPRP
jgi:hypothetical protein